MADQKESKLFAFKLAEKQAPTNPVAEWKVRDGVAVAGCTDPSHTSDWRDTHPYTNRADQGIYC